jgi:hypothetical protein
MLGFLVDILLYILLFGNKKRTRPITVIVITAIVLAIAAVTVARNTSV